MVKKQTALITTEVLKWARNLDNITPEEAAKSAGVALERFNDWETGKDLPTVKQAKKLARKYRVPFIYFYLPKPPENIKRPKNKDYRTFKNKSLDQTESRELLFTLREIMDRRNVMIELYKELEYEPVTFKYYIDIKEGTKNISNYIRNLLDLSYEKQVKFRSSRNAFNYYLGVLEDLGILVFQAANIDPQEMRGMSVYKKIFPVIIVNRKDAINARIFTLFHELVHILTKTPGICDNIYSFTEKTYDDIEVFCNKVAAKALVPKKQLEEYFNIDYFKNNTIDDDIIRNIARNFAVSRSVIIGRLLELNIIPLPIYLKKLNQYSNEYFQQKKKTKGFLPRSKDIPSQVGKLYARTVLSAYNQELITPKIASGYFSGLRLKHFPKIEEWCFQ